MKKKKLPEGTYERTPHRPATKPEKPPVLTLKEAMRRRDVDLALAMRELRAVAHDIVSSATSLMHAADPGRSPRARNRLVKAAAALVDTGTLAEDIRMVAQQLQLVETALSTAARNVRSRDA